MSGMAGGAAVGQMALPHVYCCTCCTYALDPKHCEWAEYSGCLLCLCSGDVFERMLGYRQLDGLDMEVFPIQLIPATLPEHATHTCERFV